MSDIAQHEAADELHMTRFNGLEIYEIECAKWNLYRDGNKMNLCVQVKCSKAIRQLEDTKFVGGFPHWELNLVEPKIEDASLLPGYRASIPASYDEGRGGWLTNFYFASHEGSENNEIQVVAREGEHLLLRLTGQIVDVIHYDGSKPPSKVSVFTWFIRAESIKRSMN
jgi:hypothetical protein